MIAPELPEGLPQNALRGATTLVTGGAGTIGSTIVDQLLEAASSTTSSAAAGPTCARRSRTLA
jgi:NAD(P)-dependent dehydrogenase (short-subunit alcohol dehydrogenase family)